MHIESFLREAAAHCRKHGGRLTPNRADVLCTVARSPTPLNAYGILAALGARRTAAPAMVYRSLDFLASHQLVRRLVIMNAYVACVDAVPWATDAAFFICERCSRAESVADRELSSRLESQAVALGFRLAQRVIEAKGVCARCQARETSAAGPARPRTRVPKDTRRRECDPTYRMNLPAADSG